jgi:hypothetical protein
MQTVRHNVNQWVEVSSAYSVGAIAALGVFGPLLLVPIVPLAGDVLAVAFSLVASVATGWALRHRTLVSALPMELSDQVLTGVVNGAPVYRFRARLGKGRGVRKLSSLATFRPKTGEPVVLQVLIPADLVFGPFTLVVVDGAGACVGPGEWTLEVSGTSKGQQWAAKRHWAVDEVTKGRFQAGFSRKGRRWVWDRDAWDAAA